MDKSVLESLFGITRQPHDAKTMTLGTDLSIHTSHSRQILIIFFPLKLQVQTSESSSVGNRAGKSLSIIGFP